jgi:simple sugar transport system permease protein
MGAAVTGATSFLAGRSRLLSQLLSVFAALAVTAMIIAVTGHDPLSTFQAIFEGSGLNWLLPWTSGAGRETAALNLQQTLLIATPLILLGLTVALPFRAGLFNVGGEGQYLFGTFAAVWIGSSFGGLPGWIHVVVVIVAAAVAGGALAGFAGLLKVLVGANEVITTIMLDYIAVWIGVFLFGVGGPLQDPAHISEPLSRPVVESVHLPVFWGNPLLQGAHIGIFIAIAILVVTGIVLARASIGFEIRAVGANPEAARYGGINVGSTLVKVMVVSGLFAGIAGSVASDIPASEVGFLGIAVALLARNRIGWILVSSILFAALLSGTSERNLDPSVFPPGLAGYLAVIFQAIIILAIAANLLRLRPPRWLRNRLPATLFSRGVARPAPEAGQ